MSSIEARSKEALWQNKTPKTLRLPIVSVLISDAYMNALLWVDEGPLRKNLEKGLEELSLRLRELESSIETYFSKDLPQYQSWVNHHFADDLVQIALLEKKVRCLGQHVEESVQISMQMNLHPAELFAEWTEEEMLEKIMSEEDEVPAENDSELDIPSKEAASGDTREVYRRIVRCLHPDLRGDSLSEVEKNLWVKAQKAYAKNDVFELLRLEKNLRCGHLADEPVSYSELLRQLEDFQKRCQSLEAEMNCLKQERAWKFSAKKRHSEIEKEIHTEFRGTIRELKSKEQHLHKTVSSWIKGKVTQVATPKPKKRASKSQVSLF